MSNELSNIEKIEIVNQHLKSLAYSEYNLNLTIQELQSMEVPPADSIANINLQINDIIAKRAILENELNSLSV
jgi:hypothetical protein